VSGQPLRRRTPISAILAPRRDFRTVPGLSSAGHGAAKWLQTKTKNGQGFFRASGPSGINPPFFGNGIVNKRQRALSTVFPNGNIRVPWSMSEESNMIFPGAI
jgi:hypothetical protein